MKRSLHAGEWLRRGLGVAVLASVAVIALGWDTGVLKRWSYSGTTSWEHYLLQRLGAGANDMPMGSVLALQPAASSPLASFTGERTWLNSPALSVGDLSGKVVLVDFWTYSCINCLRTLPSVKALADKYRDHGLVVVGVHSPEFAFERDEDNVRRAVHDSFSFAHQLGLVAINLNGEGWRRYLKVLVLRFLFWLLSREAMIGVSFLTFAFRHPNSITMRRLKPNFI